MPRRSHNIITALLLISTLLSCSKDEDPIEQESLDNQLTQALLIAAPEGADLDFYVFPESTDLDNIPQDEDNPLNATKVAVGKMLYHETALARDPRQMIGYGTYSCASCHHVQAGFQAGMNQGIGEGGNGFGIAGESRRLHPDYEITNVDLQPIRTPSALNVAYQEVMLWNGQFGAKGMNAGTEARWTPETPKEVNNLGFEGIETQAIAGLTVHRMAADEGFFDEFAQYVSMLRDAFPDMADTERLSNVGVGLAIGAYERTLLATEAPFQRWLKGDQEALTSTQKQGAIIFFGKGQCGSCHTGPALNQMEFYALGMNDLEAVGTSMDNPAFASATKGRGGFTGNSEDDFKFKVPQLYNLRDSPFYGHGASFTTVRQIIEYKNEAVPENQKVRTSQLAEEFQPLGLTEDEILALNDFLENGLYDANLARYVPESVLSGQCFPVNDTKAQEDLGCN